MLNASGIANCMLCGEPIVPQEEINCNYDNDLDIHGNIKVCYTCDKSCYCDCCKTFSFGKKYKIREWTNTNIYSCSKYREICPKCAREYFYFYDDKILTFVHMDKFSVWKKENPDVHYERVGGNIEQLIDKDSIIYAVQAV